MTFKQNHNNTPLIEQLIAQSFLSDNPLLGTLCPDNFVGSIKNLLNVTDVPNIDLRCCHRIFFSKMGLCFTLNRSIKEQK